MKNTEYRNCWKTDDLPECIFASFNEYGVHCCTVDRICQTRWYGCIPQEIINKKSKEIEEEEKSMKLSEDLKKWRAERPDEWTMDRFIEKATELEARCIASPTEAGEKEEGNVRLM